MPLYDFKCRHCGRVSEELTKYDVDSLPCPECGALMDRQMPMPAQPHMVLSPQEQTARMRRRSIEHSERTIDKVAVERKAFGIED